MLRLPQRHSISTPLFLDTEKRLNYFFALLPSVTIFPLASSSGPRVFVHVLPHESIAKDCANCFYGLTPVIPSLAVGHNQSTSSFVDEDSSALHKKDLSKTP